MNARTGRPKSPIPKSIKIDARIDEYLNRELEKYCQENNVTRSYVVVKGIKKVLGEKK